MKSGSFVFAAVIATLAVVAALVTSVFGTGRGHSGRSAAAYVREHPVDVPTSARTVSVSLDMPMPSAHPRRLSGMIIEGRLPRVPMMAEVLTDTQCAPDAQMISHCRNAMRLLSGETIVVRHPHDMRDIPCLTPGEKVRLVPIA